MNWDLTFHVVFYCVLYLGQILKVNWVLLRLKAFHEALLKLKDHFLIQKHGLLLGYCIMLGYLYVVEELLLLCLIEVNVLEIRHGYYGVRSFDINLLHKPSHAYEDLDIGQSRLLLSLVVFLLLWKLLVLEPIGDMLLLLLLLAIVSNTLMKPNSVAIKAASAYAFAQYTLRSAV